MTWYTVYDASTEEVIASGTSPQCAQALGLTLNSFYCAVSRSRSGVQHKYDFYIEQIKKEDFK